MEFVNTLLQFHEEHFSSCKQGSNEGWSHGGGSQPLHSQQIRGEKDLEVQVLARVLGREDKRVWLKG